MSFEEKLDKIIELLEKIDRNTLPVITWPIAPSVWVEPYGGDTSQWTDNSQWVKAEPKVCGCEHCKGVSTSTAGGCVGCGCRLVAIYTEDGNWWCNKCHRVTFTSDGSYKPQ